MLNYTQEYTLVWTNRMGYPVDMIVVHGTVGTFPGDLNWLIGSGQVSVNWVISPAGSLYLLSDQATAHAGACVWPDRAGQGLNDGQGGWGWANLCSEGVEVSTLEDGTPITTAQWNALLTLVRDRIAKFNIPPHRIVRHRDLAPGRKTDLRDFNWWSFLETLYPDHLPVYKTQGIINVAQFEAWLKAKHSPAAGEATDMYNVLTAHNIDPAVVLAIFWHESQAGTDPNYAGLVGQKNFGNLRSSGAHANGNANGFAVYPTWAAGAADWAEHMDNQYRDTWGIHTIERMIPIYAPASDNNNIQAYIDAVHKVVAEINGGTHDMSNTANMGSLNGKTVKASPEIAKFYDQYGGLLVFGFPVADEFAAKDTQGEDCRWLACENGWLKLKPSMPGSWKIRLAQLIEVAALQAQGLGHAGA